MREKRQMSTSYTKYCSMKAVEILSNWVSEPAVLMIEAEAT